MKSWRRGARGWRSLRRAVVMRRRMAFTQLVPVTSCRTRFAGACGRHRRGQGGVTP